MKIGDFAKIFELNGYWRYKRAEKRKVFTDKSMLTRNAVMKNWIVPLWGVYGLLNFSYDGKDVGSYQADCLPNIYGAVGRVPNLNINASGIFGHTAAIPNWSGNRLHVVNDGSTTNVVDIDINLARLSTLRVSYEVAPARLAVLPTISY